MDEPMLDLGDVDRVLAAIDARDEGDLLASAPCVEGYRLVRCLGEGGGGVVYLAIREGSDRPVAVKVLRAQLGTSAGARRAWRELETLAEVRLTCMPRLLDYGTTDGRLYITTEFVDGPPLDQYCADLSQRERVEVLADLADAVQSLHELGVIHRDLKPANVLVSGGHPVIIDLGIATLCSTPHLTDTLTTEGTPLGTPAFMAPEQARGERSRIGTRSDVYALGAIAMLVLTGKTPHAMGDSYFESVGRVAHDPPRTAGDLDPSLPRPLAAVLDKALSRDPAQRYGLARDLGDDLRRWLRGEPVEATTPGPMRRLRRKLARHPVLTTAVVCVLIAIGIIVGTTASVWWLNRQPRSVRLDHSQRRADIFARSGAIIGTIDSGIDGGIFDAGLIPASESASHRAEVVIAYAAKAMTHASGSVEAYLPGRLGEPLWTIPPPVLPDALMYACGSEPGRVDRSSFSAGPLVVADVLPGEPGDEILVVYRHVWSPSAIRVLSNDGRVLMEVWHDGHILDLYWMSKPGLIVAAGVNSDGKWVERVPTLDPSSISLYPVVIFAIRPQVLATPALLIWPDATPTGDLAPAWYRFLQPPELATQFLSERNALSSPHAPFDSSSHVDWELSWTGSNQQTHYKVRWVIDSTGQMVPGTHVRPSVWEVSGPDLDTRSLHLGDSAKP